MTFNFHAVRALVLVEGHDLTPATVFLALALASVLLATALLALAAFLALVALGKAFFAAFILKCHCCLLLLAGPISDIESPDCIPRKLDRVVLAERLFYSLIIGTIA
jgi:hypothetical protein